MDLVADMLTEHVGSEQGTRVAQIRPSMRRRFTRIPLFGGHPQSLNTDRLLNRFLDYPRYLRRFAANFDLFHLADHSYSHLIHELPAGRTVVTCHDLDTFRCVLQPERQPRPYWFRCMTLRILAGLRQAAHVIAVSEQTRNEILHYKLLPPERITVIPNAVHASYSPQADQEADAVAAGLIPGAKGTPWILNVGSTLPRKRIDVLLRVFAEVRRKLPNARLARVGGFSGPQTELIRQLNLKKEIVNLPVLERNVLAAVYRRAALLVHTAEAEGFGLPLIEAMASGCPVVATDLPVLREITGGAAAYCDLSDIAGWSDTILRLLEERIQHPNSWQDRRKAGLAWTERFSWTENARETVRIYRELMA